MPSTVYDPPALESGTLRVTPLGGLLMILGWLLAAWRLAR